ncbi:pimeloyl-ACP methyl ester carboxylesterase [Actinoalloteichus hoggarensis]|uniref:3-oxoadipate enol-lactonase 2 n=1 Tax=Actinoalloteichus hoggarensis TaxID=1470176 RepID=A0A221W531_9PSEU|nr:alpha/beta hydrolase [Actinoalloteichus hoggarensis]ASO20771.1 3-oxoadipate enol-lactonase 2 [Actinoalloteichus hoggarensis]MBB5920701.1 pimeloyl-ACP methyl ester carboxylesterase [Actinoalloteichus hoggarensis]
MTPRQSTGIDHTTTPDGLTPHVLNRRGTPLHYWTSVRPGAQTVVFLHGATMNHRMFNAQIPAVRDHYSVLVWDARGHGSSTPFGMERASIEDYVDDLLAVLDQENIERAVIVGQSMGGYTAQHLVRLQPHRVEALVVIGATPIAKPLSRAEMAAVGSVPTILRLWPLRSMRKAMASATTIRADVEAFARESLNGISQRDLIRILGAVATAVSRTGHPDFRIDVPCLLTHGDQDDRGTIARDMPGWAAADDRAEYVVIPDAGHNANQDNAEHFNRELLRFLRTLPSP